MASGGADKLVRLWDPVTGQQTGTLHGMTETVTEVAFTCDAKYVLASGADQAVRMWDLSSGRVRHTLTGHSQKARSSLSQACMHPCMCISAQAQPGLLRTPSRRRVEESGDPMHLGGLFCQKKLLLMQCSGSTCVKHAVCVRSDNQDSGRHACFG